jgi:DNA-binding XRE family transcriptional regulator
MKGMGKSEAKNKVLETLYYLANRHSMPLRGGWVRVKFPFSQQSMADFVGVSRETISSICKEIEVAKIVRLPRQMTIEINKERLKENL